MSSKNKANLDRNNTKCVNKKSRRGESKPTYIDLPEWPSFDAETEGFISDKICNELSILNILKGHDICIPEQLFKEVSKECSYVQSLIDAVIKTAVACSLEIADMRSRYIYQHMVEEIKNKSEVHEKEIQETKKGFWDFFRKKDQDVKSDDITVISFDYILGMFKNWIKQNKKAVNAVRIDTCRDEYLLPFVQNKAMRLSHYSDVATDNDLMVWLQNHLKKLQDWESKCLSFAEMTPDELNRKFNYFDLVDTLRKRLEAICGIIILDSDWAEDHQNDSDFYKLLETYFTCSESREGKLRIIKPAILAKNKLGDKRVLCEGQCELPNDKFLLR